MPKHFQNFYKDCQDVLKCECFHFQPHYLASFPNTNVLEPFKCSVSCAYLMSSLCFLITFRFLREVNKVKNKTISQKWHSKLCPLVNGLQILTSTADMQYIWNMDVLNKHMLHFVIRPALQLFPDKILPHTWVTVHPVFDHILHHSQVWLLLCKIYIYVWRQICTRNNRRVNTQREFGDVRYDFK